jgi:hypothetical protein
VSLCVECGTTETVRALRAAGDARPEASGVEMWRCPSCGWTRAPYPGAQSARALCMHYPEHEPKGEEAEMEKVRFFTMEDIEAKLPMLERLLAEDPDKASVWALPLLLLGSEPYSS